MSELLIRIEQTYKEFDRIYEGNHNSLNFSALRKLGGYCSSILLNNSINFEERIVAFFISSFADDLFYNFGLDTPYDTNLHEAKTEIYNILRKSLKNICVYFRKDEKSDKQKILLSLDAIIKIYYEQIKFINSTLKT